MSLDHLSFSNKFYQLGEQFFSIVNPTPVREPYFIHINEQLAQLLGIDTPLRQDNTSLSVLSGQQGLATQPPLASVYAGHQFGGYSPQLGDGRALLLAQVNTKEGLFDIQLKGAGKTPYSRFGDGRAVLRSSIREYLGSEAMYHLGIPTTRALCLVGSKEPVMREQMETGAILTRVTRSQIRFGHFEFFHYTQRFEQIKILADYVIEQYLPEAQQANDKYEQLFQHTVTSTAKMIAQWQSVGFAHGVMNTDNMSIIGETLDYGPYAFMDDYNPAFICNHSDHTGRYAFEEQPSIGLWNLNALAHALSSLIAEPALRTLLQSYESILIETYAQLMRNKLGLQQAHKNDHTLINDLLQLMKNDKVDYSYSFRLLCRLHNDKIYDQFLSLFKNKSAIQQWCSQYRQRLQLEDSHNEERQVLMLKSNPKFIARNYLLQQAIEKAQTDNDFSEIDTLFTLLQTPFAEHSQYEHYANTPPDWGKRLEISCSS